MKNYNPLIIVFCGFFAVAANYNPKYKMDTIIVKADPLSGFEFYKYDECWWAKFTPLEGVIPSKSLFLNPFTDTSMSDIEVQKAYIKHYKDLAIDQQRRHNIPASITLAQGLLESNAGRSKLALTNKNHFGIKCFSRNCKKGHCSNYTDDSHKDFFRIFATVEDSFEAHSWIIGPKRLDGRYAPCYDCGNDFRCWAKALQKAGYATDKKYAQKLIRLIKAHKLYEYDK